MKKLSITQENRPLVFILVVALAVPLLSSCHQTDVPSFKYKIENDEAIITSYQANMDEARVVLPEELQGKPVTTLEENAFYQHKNMEFITLPQSLTTISGSPFYRCYSLKELHVPHNVKQIDGNPVFRCGSLTKITVDTNNSCFTAVDGILFNKEKTELIAYPEGRTDESYTVPRSIEKIAVDAFGYDPQFKQLTVLSNVKEFPEGNMFVFPDDITLYVELNSAAEQYAKCHNLNFKIINGA